MIPAGALEVSAHSAILMDADTGAVLYEKAADQQALIASTTKIMTAMVVLEQDNLYLDETVEIPREAAGIEGSSMYLKAGETVTVRALLYGMMLSSGNDAAAALALHTFGSIEAFTARMNEKARALGLRDTHFANPNGLDSEENYSTARELGKIAMAALDTPGFREIVSARSYTAGNRQLVNHNKLLWQYPGAIGVKTGFTKRAGRILVGAAEQNGRTLISVTISDPEDWRDQNTDRVVREVVAGARDGGIILMHDIFPESVDAALQIVDQLHQQGYLFCTVDELFAARGLPLEAGEMYWNAYP